MNKLRDFSKFCGSRRKRLQSNMKPKLKNSTRFTFRLTISSLLLAAQWVILVLPAGNSAIDNERKNFRLELGLKSGPQNEQEFVHQNQEPNKVIIARSLIRNHHNIYTEFDSSQRVSPIEDLPSSSLNPMGGSNEDQPPNELIFSNQTGAVVQCRVANQLARSIERAERKLAGEHSATVMSRIQIGNQNGIQNNKQPPLSSATQTSARNFNQQQDQQSAATLHTDLIDVQIRWEKESGEPIEPMLYTSGDTANEPDSSDSDSGSSSGDDGLPSRARKILRQVRASDGALVFEPFRAQDFRADVHSATYRCIAWSESRGASLVSRDMQVKASIASSQPNKIQIEVLDELVIEGNNALFKCQLPFHARDQFQVLDWIEYPSESVHSLQSTTVANAYQLFRPNQASNSIKQASVGSNVESQHLKRRDETTHAESNGQLQSHPMSMSMSLSDSSSANFGARYFVSPKSGDLHILNVDSSFNFRTFKCRAKNKITGEIITSSNKGKLIVTDASRSSISPRLLLDTQPVPVYMEGQLALLACNQQASPKAQVTWSKKVLDYTAGATSEILQPIDVSDPKTSGFAQVSGLLLINRVHRNHSGFYVCQANNSAGEERLEVELLVREPLKAKLSVSANVLELGKSLALDCSVSGYPIHQIVFKHNQNVIKSISSIQSSSTSKSNYRATSNAMSLGSRSRLLSGAARNYPSSSSASGSEISGPEASGYFVVDEMNNKPIGASVTGSLASKQASSSQFESDATSTSESAPNSADEPDVAELIGLQHSRQRKQEVAGNNLSHIIVIVLEPQHTGAYQCFAYNQYESVQSSAYIRVLDDPPKFKDTFRSQVIDKHQDISLQCSARANPLPEITWTVDEQPIPESSRIRFGDFVTKDNLVISYVNITRAEVFDTGQYKCVADNKLAQVSHEAQINVAGPLQVKPMSNITVLASTSFRVRCPVAGYPIKEIQWHHNGRRLPSNHRQRVYENGSLEVEHMERSQNDHGLYTCLASSLPIQQTQQQQQQQQMAISAGQQLTSSATAASDPANQPASSALGSVYVSIKAKPTIEPFSISRSLREGQRASIMCTISSGDLPIQISWFRNDQPLQIEGQELNEFVGQQRQVSPISGQPQVGSFLTGVRVNQVSGYSSTLLFESLLVQHSGNYTCFARNDAGSSSYQATMIVQVAPKWSFEPADSSVIRGASVSIDCMASGFPLPRIIWTKAVETSHLPILKSTGQDQTMSSKSHQQLGSWVYENGSLNILDARDSDQGYYMCQASNGVGPGLSKVIKVTIHVAAQFMSRNSVQFVIRGDQTQLRCQSHGDWPIAIHWFRAKNRLEPIHIQESSDGSTGSVALIPGSSSPSTWSMSQLRNAAAKRVSSSSLLQQVNALILSNSQDPNDAVNDDKVGSRGSLIPRYSLSSSEQVIGASGLVDSASGTGFQLDSNAMTTNDNNHALLGLSSKINDGSNKVIQLSSVLTISQADRTDTNTYKCIAVNNFGVDERAIQLIVQDVPERIDEITVVEVNSRSIVLGWLAPHDGNSPIVNYQILYRQASSSLNPQTGTLSQIQPESVEEQSWFNYTLPVSSASSSSGFHNSSIGSASSVAMNHGKLSIHPVGQPSTATSSAVGSGSGRTIFKISINSLRPLTQYWFRVGAENKQGHGPLSRVIEAATQEEAPGAAPSKLKAVAHSSSTIMVSWSRVNDKDLFGSVHGYYVAYKLLPNSDMMPDPNQTSSNNKPKNSDSSTADQPQIPSSSIYKTVAHDDKLTKFDALLTGLQKSSQYAISVAAYNARGMGPSSEPIVVRTLEMDPPRQVRLLLKQATNCSIEIEWRPLSVASLELLGQHQQGSKVTGKFDAGQLTGPNDRTARTEATDSNAQQGDIVDFYTLFQADFNDRPRWIETRIGGSASSHVVKGLRCGSHYQFYMVAANRIGRGEQSAILDTKTVGGVPKAPETQSAFDVINITCYILRLDRWNENGCPIRQFNVRYRDESSVRNEWLQVAQVNLNQSTEAQIIDGSSGQSMHESNGSQITRSKRWDKEQGDESLEDSAYSLDYPSLAAADAAASGLDRLMILDYSPNNPQDTPFEGLNPVDEQQNQVLPDKQPESSYDYLRNSMGPSFEEQDLPSLSPISPEDVRPPKSRQYQASEMDSLGKLRTVQRGASDAQMQDRKRVPICNLNPNVHYVVQVFASNAVGGSDAELHLFTSPEGLEFDNESKRQVVANFGSGNRLAQLAFNDQRSFNRFLNINQWPVVLPVLLAILLIGSMVMVSFLLRRSQSGSNFGSNSSTTTTTKTITKSLESEQHCRNFLNGDVHHHDQLGHYHLHPSSHFEAAPSSSISEAAATIALSGCTPSELDETTNNANNNGSSNKNNTTYAFIRTALNGAAFNESNEIYQRQANLVAESKFREDPAYGALSYTLTRQNPIQINPNSSHMSTLPHIANNIQPIGPNANTLPHNHEGPIFMPTELQQTLMTSTLPHNSMARNRNVYLCSNGPNIDHHHQPTQDDAQSQLKFNEAANFYGQIADAQFQQNTYGQAQANCNQMDSPPTGHVKTADDNNKNYMIPNAMFQGANNQQVDLDHGYAASSFIESTSSGTNNTASSSQSGPMTKQQYDNCFMSIVEEVARANESLTSQLDQSRGQQQSNGPAMYFSHGAASS